MLLLERLSVPVDSESRAQVAFAMQLFPGLQVDDDRKAPSVQVCSLSHPACLHEVGTC